MMLSVSLMVSPATTSLSVPSTARSSMVFILVTVINLELDGSVGLAAG